MLDEAGLFGHPQSERRARPTTISEIWHAAKGTVLVVSNDLRPARPHRRQFVVGPEAVLPDADWTSEPLGELVLSRHSALPVCRFQLASGEPGVLLGTAVRADAIGATVDILEGCSGQELTSAVADLAGRWIIVCPHLIIPDATNLANVCIRQETGQCWVSSSPALLACHMPGLPEAPRMDWDVRHARLPDHIPAPLTGREGVRRVLPGTSVDPRTGEERALPEVTVTPVDAAIGPETLLSNIMANWAAVPAPCHAVTLTGGLDTRTLLAAAVGAASTPLCVTTGTAYLDGPDRYLPPLLARRAGLQHVLISGQPVPGDDQAHRQQVMDAHSDGMSYHPIASNYAKGTLDLDLPPGTQIAFGQVFEMFRIPPAIGGPDDRACPRDVEAVFAGIDQAGLVPRPLWTRAFEAWLEARRTRPAPVSLTMDQYWHFDQRSGSWVAQVQHCADLLPFERFYPGSCLRLIATMAQAPWSTRAEGASQRQIIAKLAPALDSLPYNRLSGWVRLKAAVLRRLRRLRST